MQDSEFISKLIDLFSDRHRHTTHTVARTATGEACNVLSNKATCWCLVGGIGKIGYKDKANAWSAIKIINQTLQQEYGTWDKGRFNDDYGYDKVIEMLHKAKALALSKEQHTK